MGAEEAIGGLRRTEERLEAYAAERGLTLRVDPVYPGAPPPAEQTGPFRHAVWSIAGRFPGGALGRLRHQAVYGRMLGVGLGTESGGGQHTLFLSRLPESVGYVPMLNLRPADFGAGLFAWAGDTRQRQSVEFESAELGRRYVIEVAEGQDPAWLYQLFPPSFIDWLAHSTPRDFSFRLDAGVFLCECPQWRGQTTALTGEVEPEYLDQLADAAGRVASRIREEVFEEVGTPGQWTPDSMLAAEARAGGGNTSRLVRGLARLLGGADDSVKDFAAAHGLAVTRPAEFHARQIGLPLPGLAEDVVVGRLPAGGPDGALAWIRHSSVVEMERNAIAVVADAGVELPLLWLDEADVGIPAFGEGVPDRLRAFLAERGLGFSAVGRSFSVYTSGETPGNWPGSERAIALCTEATEVATMIREEFGSD